MQRLIFGGSFNPIHHGHLICARAVAEALGYHRVALMPTALSPHKVESAMLADSGHRLTMARLAVVDEPLFDVDDLEISREGPSFTLDTARLLAGRGEKPVDWLIGADMLMYLPKWHRPLELLQEVKFIIMARPAWTLDWSALPAEFQHLQENVVPAPLIDVRATDIRARVARGDSIRYLTPETVCRYIEEKGLYRS